MNLRPFVICFAQDVQSPQTETVVYFISSFLWTSLGLGRIIVGVGGGGRYYCEDPIKTEICACAHAQSRSQRQASIKTLRKIAPSGAASVPDSSSS